jgi:hypothetical protein
VDLFQWLLVGHLAVFGAWFGTDLGTFYLSRRVIDPSIEVPTRAVIARNMMGIEVIARLCLPTMLALGLALSIEAGYLDLSTSMLWVILVAWAAWIALIWTLYQRGGEVVGALGKLDLVFRAAVCLALWFAGIASAFTDDGAFTQNWLGAKVVLFAVIMTSGIIIRFALKPFSAAFGTLVSEGSSPEREAAMAGALRRAQPLVGVIWISLALSLILAVGRQVPWG